MANSGDSPSELEVLAGIGRELAGIRRELEGIRAAVEDPAETDPTEGSPTYDCKHCEEAFNSDSEAKRHAVDGHGAPADSWEICYP